MSPWDKFWSHRAFRALKLGGAIAIFLEFGGFAVIEQLLNGADSPLERLECIFLAAWYLFSSHRAAYGTYFLLNGVSLALANRFLLSRKFRAHRQAVRELTEVSHLGVFLRTYRMWKIQVAVATVLLFAILPDYHLLFVAFHAIVFYAWGWIRCSVPPAVLLLAQSDDIDPTQLHWELRGAVDPLRVVSFLGYYRPDGTHLPPSRIQLDCLRSSNAEDWWGCVTDVMAVAPIIVIDGRDTSEDLVREAAFIVQGPLVGKTIFVGSSDEQCPLLDQLGDIDRHEIIVLDRQRVVEAVAVATSTGSSPLRHWPEFSGDDLPDIARALLNERA